MAKTPTTHLSAGATMHIPTALYPAADIRAIEKAALASLPAGTLMQRAGQAAADIAIRLLPAPSSASAVLVLAGPGNNGGDALEAAHLLARTGRRVSILLCAEEARLPPDAKQALARAQAGNACFLPPTADSIRDMPRWDLVIDGLFGIGLARPISDPLCTLVEAVNALDCPVLALDVPSGLDADTGCVIGANGIAVQATHTVTFIADKPGLYTCDGRDHAGAVQVAHLDMERSLFMPARAHLNHPASFGGLIRPRRHNSHKGSYGDVIVLGGAAGMAGAPVLAARAAAKCGAGRVFAAFVDAPVPYDDMQPELMCRLAHDIDFSSATLVAGPGLGTSSAARELVGKALEAQVPLVLDADALNLIAAEPQLAQQLAQRSGPAVLTPHPLEAARLLRTGAQQVQADRLAAARRLAHQFNAIVILKGSGSIIANAAGDAVINTTGNPALATAGTGDVLAGICGALLAQSIPPWHAALAAVWLHGQAADELVNQGIGPIGLTASELLPAARAILNRIARGNGQRGPRRTD